jgi:hypothetical protein
MALAMLLAFPVLGLLTVAPRALGANSACHIAGDGGPPKPRS